MNNMVSVICLTGGNLVLTSELTTTVYKIRSINKITELAPVFTYLYIRPQVVRK